MKTFKQKCISTIVTVNDGRLDSLTLGQLHKIVDFLLTENDPYAVQWSQNLVKLYANELQYIKHIIDEMLKVE